MTRDPRLRQQRSLDPDAVRPRLHGLVAAEVAFMLQRQGGTCLVCGGGNGGEAWQVDHDHALAAGHPHPASVGCKRCVRGIICRPCNSGLGFFRDDPAVMRRAADYVEAARARGGRA